MNGFLFKQQGTDTKVPRSSVPGLTVRHLQYIATRPGAVYNPGCGFSLWGSLQPFAAAENLTDLEYAKRLVRAEAERGRTIYRAVISLGEPEAGERGYYDRAKWETLAKAQAGEIAKKLHIAAGNFRWMASMHYAAGHPHMHMIYWDAGREPRKEYMPPDKFAAYSEGVRASLNRFEWGQEIKESQTEQTEAGKDLRLELRALCRECNPTGGLKLKALYGSKQMASIEQRLDALVRDMPVKGSLKYAYLPPRYKAQVDALAAEIRALPQFRQKLRQYMAATDRISGLYGNGEKTMAANREKAVDRLNRDMGNEIMEAVQNVRKEMELEAPEDSGELETLARDAVRTVLRNTKQYEILRDMLPRDRIPVQQMRELPGFQAAQKAVLDSLLVDARVRVPLNAYAKKLSQETAETETETETETEKEPGDRRSAYRRAYSTFFRAANRELYRILQEDKGYAAEARETHATQTVCVLFRLLSQLTGQRQAAATLAASKLMSRDRSREARMDKAQQASQGEGWTPNL